MSDVERITFSGGAKVQVVSVSGKGVLEQSKLSFLQNCTLWNSLFPIHSGAVQRYLQNEIFRDLTILAVQLEAPRCIREAIDMHVYDIDIEQASRELVKWWLSPSSHLRCWWHLVEALEQMDYKDVADAIQQEHSRFYVQ